MSTSHSDSVVRARKLTAGILTALTAVFTFGFVAIFGTAGAIILMVTLPLPMLFIWASAPVLRSDEAKS